jgi:chaperone modulatory protein CbpM
MIGLSVLVRRAGGLAEADLRHWIAQSWVRPAGPPEAPEFQDIDVARVRLIVELRRDLGVNDDAVPVVLSLLDQLYRERDHHRRLRAALNALPREALEAVANEIADEER